MFRGFPSVPREVSKCPCYDLCSWKFSVLQKKSCQCSGDSPYWLKISSKRFILWSGMLTACGTNVLVCKPGSTWHYCEDYSHMFPARCNITQFVYFWKTALHVSGGIATHHQELHKTVFTASGTCQTVTATCRYRGKVGTGPVAILPR